jgi:plastocyanin
MATSSVLLDPPGWQTETTGTFAYRCAIHPDMRGTVRVGG